MKKKTNTVLKKTVQELRSTKSPCWVKIAELLEKPTRGRASVNLYRINKNTKDGDTVVVPGKVLGVGEMEHKVTVAALGFSSTAREKLKDSATILELAKKNPKATGVIILK